MKEILFLKPFFKETIWGGNKLKYMYGYDIPSDKTGEIWCVSANKNGETIIKNGIFKNKKLSYLWDNYREIFGNIKGKEFPLLIKMIDANKDLSIQVHPDNEYASKNENGSLGKNEFWYILDCDENNKIIIGHNARTKAELKKMIADKQWNKLLNEYSIKKDDFFQIPSGTIHAIKGGTVILEIQQNSDITYRLYDYDRLSSNGERRELHLDKSLDVINCPYEKYTLQKEIKHYKNYYEEKLIKCQFYQVSRLKIHGTIELVQDKAFEIINVINGIGKVNNTKIIKGDSFILPYNFGKYTIKGNLEIFTTNI